MNKPPVHLRQPRAPQAVPAREASYAEGFLAGAVMVLACVLLFGMVMAALRSSLTDAVAVAMFIGALVCATVLGLWAVSR